ncbi:hypothetical protein NOCARDAX2BIS_220133 [Nocardioides sp. AX2bis]|nr:hypothetical protein NOCARDAX2BIS_220133 [Nocardioides sp. AX2bis]
MLNAVFSTGNQSDAVVRVLGRYCARRDEQGADPKRDGPDELIAEIERCGGPDEFADELDNHWRAWQSKAAPYKTTVILGAAQLLKGSDVQTSDDLKLAMASADEHNRLKSGWLALPGQRSGLTWRYFLMNSGMPGIKADRMITRWVSRAVGRTVKPTEAEAILLAAAERLSVDANHLDHAVWAVQRGRR